ncbi:MAG TPA: hypothetical protein VFF67_09995 [Thermoplasmata archaeon]|nr:hypothetical protein [Thermoplasmata archaeon]
MTGPPGVEDPISAIFDLSDRAAEMAPTVRRMYRYTATIVVIWIVLMAGVTLGTLGGAPWLSILSLLGLIAGVIALSLLRQTDRFFGAFVQRHRSIRLVRDADPVVKVPEGRTPIERLGRYLVQSNPTVESALQESPSAMQYRVALPASGREIVFDLTVVRPGGALWRSLGRGRSGFAILARLAGESVALDDLRRLEADAQAVAARLPARIVRLILLRPRTGPLPEDAYEYAVGHAVELRHGTGRSRAQLEVISENPDGTYDFVPHVLGVP